MQMELHLANEQCVECQSSGPAVEAAPEPGIDPYVMPSLVVLFI